MAMYYNGKKVRNLYYNGKCITRLALGKEMTRLVEGDDFVRAEWLCGRNGAYINTNHKLVTIEDKFDVKARWDGDLTRENDIFGYLTDNANVDRTYAIGIIHYSLGSNLCTSYRHYLGNFTPIQHRISPNIPFSLSLYADNSKYYSVCNGNKISQITDGMTIDTYDDVYLFNMNIGDPAKKATQLSRYFNGDIAYFIICSSNVEVINLTPCRLLRPIPATLDGNGIARNAGECGMYDSVSGKFYGNVAPSGAFTVEPSLVEGVDYETYDYLVVSISTTSNVVMMSLPVDSYNVSFIREWSRYNVAPHSSYFIMDGYSYFTNANYSVLIWNGSATIYESTDRFSYGGMVNINCNSQNYNFNGESAPIYGAIKAVRFDCVVDNPNVGWSGSFATSKITVDGVVRYIPVRLLRPLPSYLDANGKARSQFECGMLDLKTMKFYGNVNTSGKFTVSDN